LKLWNKKIKKEKRMLIELTEEQRRNLVTILGDANIKGAQWRVIGDLEAVLNTPANSKEEKKVPDKNEPSGSD